MHDLCPPKIYFYSGHASGAYKNANLPERCGKIITSIKHTKE